MKGQLDPNISCASRARGLKTTISYRPVYSAAKLGKVFHVPLQLYWVSHAELLHPDSSRA